MNDLISRKALREEIESEIYWGIASHGAILQAIDDAPSVDAVEVVHGRWVHPKGYVVSNGFLCSACGHEESSHHPINPRSGGCCIADENGNFFHPPKINFCPNCGSDMRERKDHEDSRNPSV